MPPYLPLLQGETMALGAHLQRQQQLFFGTSSPPPPLPPNNNGGHFLTSPPAQCPSALSAAAEPYRYLEQHDGLHQYHKAMRIAPAHLPAAQSNNNFKNSNFVTVSSRSKTPTRGIDGGRHGHRNQHHGRDRSGSGSSNDSLISQEEKSPRPSQPLAPVTPIKKKSNYKTELCRFYMSDPKSCLRGDQCTYAHGSDELRKMTLGQAMEAHDGIAPAASAAGAAVFRTKPCFTFCSTGDCPMGSKCCDIHDPRIARTGQPRRWRLYLHKMSPTRGGLSYDGGDVHIAHQYYHELAATHYGGPFGNVVPPILRQDGKKFEQHNNDEDSSKVWRQFRETVCNKNSANNEDIITARGLLTQEQLLDIASRMAYAAPSPSVAGDGAPGQFKYRTTHIFLPNSSENGRQCMLLQRRSFLVPSDGGDVVEIPEHIPTFAARRSLHGEQRLVVVREIAFHPDGCPSAPPVALWFSEGTEQEEMILKKCDAQTLVKNIKKMRHGNSLSNNKAQPRSYKPIVPPPPFFNPQISDLNDAIVMCSPCRQGNKKDSADPSPPPTLPSSSLLDLLATESGLDVPSKPFVLTRPTGDDDALRLTSAVLRHELSKKRCERAARTTNGNGITIKAARDAAAALDAEALVLESTFRSQRMGWAVLGMWPNDAVRGEEGGSVEDEEPPVGAEYSPITVGGSGRRTIYKDIWKTFLSGVASTNLDGTAQFYVRPRLAVFRTISSEKRGFSEGRPLPLLGAGRAGKATGASAGFVCRRETACRGGAGLMPRHIQKCWQDILCPASLNGGEPNAWDLVEHSSLLASTKSKNI